MATASPADLYVYAIVHRAATLPPALAGLDDAPLTLVPWRALAAVVSQSTRRCYPARPSADLVLRHEAVVEAIHQAAPALPVRFSTVLPSDAVPRALEQRYDLLLADLTRIGDKVEVGVTLLWDNAEDAPDAPPATLHTPAPEPPPGAGAGTRYLLARRDAYRSEQAERALAQATAAELEACLKPHVREGRHTVHVLPRAMLRAAYLVEPPALAGLRRALTDFRVHHPTLRCLITGPWPPYSFVSSADGLLGVAGGRAEPIP